MKELVSHVSFLKHTRAADRLRKKSRQKKPRFFNDSSHEESSGCSNTEGIELTHSQPQLYGIRTLFETLKSRLFLRHYGEGPVFSDYPKFHYIGLNYIIDAKRLSETQLSWGYCLPGEDVEVAFSKALGESLERQASYYHPALAGDKRFPRLSRGDASYLYPLMAHFSAIQLETITKFPLVKDSSDLEDCLGFTASSLTGDKKRFFPFECFYWGTPVGANQRLLFHPTSSGSGGGTSRAQAVVSGWYEAIERDHLLLYWFSGVQPNQIDLDSLPDTLGDYIRSCRDRYGLEIHFLDLRHDVDVLVAACVVIDPILNIVTMGAKVGTNATDVLRSSLLEALAVLSSTRSRNQSIPETQLTEILSHPPFTREISRTGRVNLYNSPKGINLIRTSFLSGRTLPFDTFVMKSPIASTVDYQLDYLRQNFKSLIDTHGPGYHAYVHDFESPWLKELSYHAAHVFIPSLLKLHLNETLATPVSERLNQFIATKRKTGYQTLDTVNALPHFFP